jgi:hypothetical protein
VNLGAGLRAVLLGEKYVVVLTRVERRIKIDEVNRLILQISLKDFEIVAVIKQVFVGSHWLGRDYHRGIVPNEFSWVELRAWEPDPYHEAAGNTVCVRLLAQFIHGNCVRARWMWDGGRW